VFAGHDRPSATAIIPELPPQDSITPEADKSLFTYGTTVLNQSRDLLLAGLLVAAILGFL
jgi:hypothetical protein